MIKTIRYHNFRNIKDIEISIEPGLNILHGDNGQGKTNFIEGLHLCLTGDTFRFGENIDLIKTGESQASVSILYEDKSLNEIKFTIEKGKKIHWVNGKKMSTNQLSNQYPVVLFSPESLSSVKEGSSERRDLIDQFLLMCSDLNYRRLFDDYFKILKTKNKVLKSYINQIIQKEQAINLLESYEENFINLATGLTNKRIQGLRAIINDFKTAADLLYQNPVDISVEYLISSTNALHYESDRVYENIKKRLFELKVAELAVGHSLVGPQKHEINFLVNNKSSRIFCSQGQQRTLILAFKLAQMMYHSRVYGTVPILFLDDVLSELDSATRLNLVKCLNKMEGQIFITTTDKYLCRDLTNQNQKYVSVCSGRFSF